MEELEIHSKSYLVRWVNVKPETTIAWTVKPHKKSINFGIFKHPGHLAGWTSVSSVITSVNPPPSPSPETYDNAKDSLSAKEPPSTAVEKLAATGLKQILWAGRYEADKIARGTYDVPMAEAGNYALVFDNTFSKSVSKTATFFLLTYPSKCHSQIQFGAQLHHSQAMASALPAAPPQTSRFSPRLRARTKESTDSLKLVGAQPTLPAVSPLQELPAVSNAPVSMFTGVLQKRRRKKHQGYARRFFSLDFTSATLSYYHDRNSSALRGAVPLALAAIGANARTREISIDSGAEIWHLKANNKGDFDEWKKALEKASRLMAESTHPMHGLNSESDYYKPGEVSIEAQDWMQLENLLGRLSGTRDAVRRLFVQADAKSMPLPSPGLESEPSTPTEAQGEDYFRQDEKRPFWKRKPSANNSQAITLKRSVSAQLAVPVPRVESLVRSNSTIPPSPLRSPSSHQHLRGYHSGHEEGFQDQIRAMQRDLESVVLDFSAMIVEIKKRRPPVPQSAVSRMSLQSIDSQEYFDADDGRPPNFLNLQYDTDEEGKTEEDHNIVDDDSATSSDIDDSETYSQSRKAVKSGSLASLLPPRAKTLTPLPHDTVVRRTNVSAPTIMPPSLIGFLRKNVGKDLSTISMPISANEPISLLQRAAEQLEYSSLLDRASKATDALERLIYTTAFAISSLSGARVKERSIRKPFNPMLGETFELIREDRGFRYVSEKVSHRPVRLAFLAESCDWCFTQSPSPSQKFWGKSSEIITDGKARVLLHASGECLSWSAATCFLRNIIAGEKYVEPVGSMTVVNETTGHKAVVSFKAKGMFSGRSEDLDVRTFDSHGTELPLGLEGTWTQSLRLKEHGKITETIIWTVGPLVDNAPKHYGLPLFVAAFNEITDMEKGKLPLSDSRLRPDQRALEDGAHDEAERLKNRLEESQRTRRKAMEAKGENWKPRWFSPVEGSDEALWQLKTGKEGYWEERARDEWTGVVPVLKL